MVTRGADPAGADTALAGRRVGVRAGTTAETYAMGHGVPTPAARSESNDELYTALAAGRLDAIIDDAPIAAHFAREHPGLRVAGALPETDAAYAMMVQKGHAPLRDAIDAALAGLESDGTLSSLRLQWNLPRR